MPVTISGTTGIAGVDGSAGTPAVQGGDSNTGIFFPAADTIAFAEGGAEVARFDSSGNLGIGTSSPGARLDVSGGVRVSANQEFSSSAYVYSYAGGSAGQVRVGHYLDGTNNVLQMITGQAERARIDSSGNLLVGTTTSSARLTVQADSSSVQPVVFNSTAAGTGATSLVRFRRNGTNVGEIEITGSATTYATSSDYRLKHDIAPMTGALAKVAALKPVTYKWNADDSNGEGFIAHELAEVCPGAVTGEKDAVDAEGNIVPQGIDTSFLVATLTAAIQELKAELDTAKARIAALEAA